MRPVTFLLVKGFSLMHRTRREVKATGAVQNSRMFYYLNDRSDSKFLKCCNFPDFRHTHLPRQRK